MNRHYCHRFGIFSVTLQRSTTVCWNTLSLVSNTSHEKQFINKVLKDLYWWPNFTCSSNRPFLITDTCMIDKKLWLECHQGHQCYSVAVKVAQLHARLIGKKPPDVFAWISKHNLFQKDWRVLSQKIKCLYISLPQKLCSFRQAFAASSDFTQRGECLRHNELCPFSPGPWPVLPPLSIHGKVQLGSQPAMYCTGQIISSEKKVTFYMALPPLPNISLRDITTVHKNAFLSDYKLSLRLYFKHLQAKKLGFRCSAVPKSHPFPWYISGKNSAASFPFKTQCTSKNRLHPLKCYFYSIPLGFVFWFVFKPLWQLAVKDLSVMK